MVVADVVDHEAVLPAGDNGHVRVAIQSPLLELHLQVQREHLLLIPRPRHGFVVSQRRLAPSLAHVGDFRVALVQAEVVHERPQRSHC